MSLTGDVPDWSSLSLNPPGASLYGTVETHVAGLSKATLLANIVAGDLLVAFVLGYAVLSAGSVTGTTVTDDGGLTWTKRAEVVSTRGANVAVAAIWTAPNNANATPTITGTINLSVGGTTTANGISVTGAGCAIGTAVSQGTAGSTSAVAAPVTGMRVAAAGACAILGFIAFGTTTVNAGVPAGWSVLENVIVTVGDDIQALVLMQDNLDTSTLPDSITNQAAGGLGAASAQCVID